MKHRKTFISLVLYVLCISCSGCGLYQTNYRDSIKKYAFECWQNSLHSANIISIIDNWNNCLAEQGITLKDLLK